MSEIKVSSWGQLIEELFDQCWNPALNRFRSQFAWRGLSDSGFELQTTLSRLGGDYDKLEKHLLRNFRKYAYRNVIDKESDWDWLSVAQHFGLPTRLMDWTFSPYVALHFATADTRKFNVDAAVWGMNFVLVHQFLPESLRAELSQEGADIFTTGILSQKIRYLQDFKSSSLADYVLFFEPPSIDDRIVNQAALFLLPSSPTLRLGDWLAQHPEVYKKIIIPAQLKWEIRDKLDQANITERVLFPGLEGLSVWLKRHYSPKM